jgi:hypothetical protein
MPKNAFLTFDTCSNDLVQYKGTWLLNCKVSSIDIDMRSKDEKITIMEVFKKILASFNTNIQLTLKKFPLDFSTHILKVKNYTLQMPNQKLKEYSTGYVAYLEELAKGKLDKVNYFTIRTDRKCTYEQAKSYLFGVANQIQRELEQLSMIVEPIVGQELKKLYTIPDFIKEEIDYFIFGKEFKRTYIILNYPHQAFPNYLKPLLNFPHPIELTQHIHPFPRDKVINSLEKAIAKLDSTINMQAKIGVPSTEIVAKKNDAEDLLNRLASGADNIIETGFYITISADSLERLNNITFELEGALRQLQVSFRRCIKDNNKAAYSTLPLCEDCFMDENYTFDTLSLSRLVPFTAQDYTTGGVLYGINEQLNELITCDIFNELASYTKVILGKPGYGKSVLAKLEMGRQLSNGVQVIGVDNNKEYKELCYAWGGQYVEPGQKPNWNNHMIIFSGENKTKDLDIILDHLHNSQLRPRIVTVDEFQIILRENKSLVLNLVQTVRKTFASPTLITQNVQELLRSEEGRMIIDNSTMKFLMHQGENDVAAIEELFDLTKEEKLYLKTTRKGYGYLITDLFRTKFRAVCSAIEYDLITTDPKDKLKRMV